MRVDKKSNIQKNKINGEIRFPQVRLTHNGQSSIMSSYEAAKIAESEGKDLILISENANPPVVRIDKYDKYLYELQKKEKEAKRNAKKNEIKEINLSLNIAEHDLGIKSRKAIEFLEDGNRVKCSMILKGRQNNMHAKGELVMLKFANLVVQCGLPESMPKYEGNKWLMIIKPKKK